MKLGWPDWRQRAALFGISLGCYACVNAVSYVVLSHNLDRGVYPVDADSIGLPLVSGLLFAVVSI